MSKALNLLYDPWIRASDPKGNVKELGILDLFRDADKLSVLSGETVVQDAAVLRLLLGVLYSVFTRYTASGQAIDTDEDSDIGEADMKNQWFSLWRNRRIPMDVVENYITQYADRFYLIHPEFPFWQVAHSISSTSLPVRENGIMVGFGSYSAVMKSDEKKKKGARTKPDKPKDADDKSDKDTGFLRARLAGDVGGSGNKTNPFNIRESAGGLSLSEAARWLVYHNSFDISPGGNAGGNPRKVNAYKQPWPTGIGLTWIQGKTLFETLMLNLVLSDNKKQWAYSEAWWEVPYPCQTIADLERIVRGLPKGIVELMSMQFRYSRLVPNESLDEIIGIETWSGTILEDVTLLETMTPWLVSKEKKDKKDKSKAPKPEKYKPKKHRENVQMWRDLSSFIASNENQNLTPPGVIRWLSSLNLDTSDIRICIAGVQYTNSTVISDYYSDSLSVNADIYKTLSEAWRVRLVHTVAATDRLVSEFGEFAVSMARASGMKGKSDVFIEVKKEAIKKVYYCLDGMFREWLSSVNPLTDTPGDKCNAWLSSASKEILKLGREMVDRAGSQAYIGHTYRKRCSGGVYKDVLYVAPKEYSTFKSRVFGILKKEGVI